MHHSVQMGNKNNLNFFILDDGSHFSGSFSSSVTGKEAPSLLFLFCMIIPTAHPCLLPSLASHNKVTYIDKSLHICQISSIYIYFKIDYISTNKHAHIWGGWIFKNWYTIAHFSAFCYFPHSVMPPGAITELCPSK